MTAATIAPLTYTAYYGYKNGLPNYSNEEASLFVQAPIDPDSTPEQIDQLIREAFAFAKSHVLGELDLPFTQSEDGVVRPSGGSATVREAAKPAPSVKPASAASGGDDKTAAWEDLVSNPDKWFDNRVDKRNPKGPDFKGKNSGAFNGVGLWLNSAPEFVKLVKPEWF